MFYRLCANSKFKKVFFSAYDTWIKNRSQPSYATYSKFYEILEIISTLETERGKFSYVPLSSRTPIYEAIKHINDHLCEKISVEYLSGISGKSERRFNDLFKNETGKTPLEYINDLKIDMAKRYLESGTYSVFEIAHMLGFSDESYFNRLFKLKTGISPGKYSKFIIDKFR